MMDHGTTGGRDVRMIVLKCPQCGGELRVGEGSDQARCAHCGTNVLILDAQAGRTRIDTPGEDTAESEAAKTRMVKIALWGTAISIAFPLVITVLVSIIISVVLVIIGIMMFFVDK